MDQLYRRILGRTPDGGRHGWIDRVNRGDSRYRIALDFYGSMESRRRRVTALYLRFLQRPPDGPGRENWAHKLANGDDLALATFLSGSSEYEKKAINRFPDPS